MRLHRVVLSLNELSNLPGGTVIHRMITKGDTTFIEKEERAFIKSKGFFYRFYEDGLSGLIPRLPDELWTFGLLPGERIVYGDDYIEIS